MQVTLYMLAWYRHERAEILFEQMQLSVGRAFGRQSNSTCRSPIGSVAAPCRPEGEPCSHSLGDSNIWAQGIDRHGAPKRVADFCPTAALPGIVAAAIPRRQDAEIPPRPLRIVRRVAGDPMPTGTAIRGAVVGPTGRCDFVRLPKSQSWLQPRLPPAQGFGVRSVAAKSPVSGRRGPQSIGEALLR